MRPLVCDAQHVSDVRRYATLLGSFLSQYSWLNDAYVLDYFVEQQWHKLPYSWQKTLSTIELSDLSTWLETGLPAQKHSVWPLSLMCLAPAARLLALNRSPVASPADIPLLLPNERAGGKNLHWPAFHLCGNRNLTHAFRKHVKLKKQHEIVRLAMAAIHVQKKKAMEIEAEGADSPCYLPQHVELEISMATTPAELEQVAEKAWGRGKSGVENFVLVGLHTCGNLGPSMIQLFADSPAARGLISVGCCYMKLSEDKCEGIEMKMAYPMSSHVCALGNVAVLGYQAREVACHAFEVYTRKLKESPLALKIHCYRALLERLIVNRYKDQRHCGLGSVKHADSLTFSQYARKALEKFPLTLPDEDLDSPELELAMDEWQRVVVFYSLRLLLAPVIESLILVDRMLYLWDRCISSSLLPLFDPCLSPRNLVLLAFKANSRKGEQHCKNL
ncbi:methyltransferase-like protein 25B isoform X2 [Dermacentor andersoni]|uniref:methyltransferase-like protein 25B isoform X2 n=1 Tax=Dermacentor andersoni TaxID=34620 RepID=UPI0024178D3D|nr:methyltransferase-like protein 25B isoform X2 [Dermacentor andersoni]